MPPRVTRPGTTRRGSSAGRQRRGAQVAPSYRIFLSHGGADAWIASQIAARLQDCGAMTFLDNNDLSKGDDFKQVIRVEVGRSDELVALFTPWSIRRNWVWVEIGAAWVTQKRVVIVLYQVTLSDLDTGGGRAVLNDLNLVDINEIEHYFREVRLRVEGRGS
jgi:TIR domain